MCNEDDTLGNNLWSNKIDLKRLGFVHQNLKLDNLGGHHEKESKFCYSRIVSGLNADMMRNT